MLQYCTSEGARRCSEPEGDGRWLGCTPAFCVSLRGKWPVCTHGRLWVLTEVGFPPLIRQLHDNVLVSFQAVEMKF